MLSTTHRLKLRKLQNLCRINRSDLSLLKLNFKNPVIAKTKGTLVNLTFSHCDEIYKKSNRLSPYKLPGNFFTNSDFKINECKEVLKKYIKFENKNYILRNMKNLSKNNFRLTDTDTLKLHGSKYNILISWRNGFTMFHRKKLSIKTPTSCCLCKEKIECNLQLHLVTECTSTDILI